MLKAITAYEGTENYIFISYAHKDTEKVFPIMEELHNRGYRIWYDDGIAPGSEWPEDIAKHLNGCAMAIAFVSPNSMASVNCRREINFALSKQKPFLSVILEPTEMPLGMELQLSAQQSVLRYNYRTEEQFIEKICSCPDLACCRKPVAEPEPAAVAVPVSAPEKVPEPAEKVPQKETPVKSEPPKTQPPKKSGVFLGIAIGAVALVIAALVLFLTSSKPNGEDPSISGSETTAPQTVETTSVNEAVEEYTIHVKIPQSWENCGLWAWSDPDGREAFEEWPGLTMEMGPDGWYIGTVPSWINYVSISGNDGTYESAYVPVEKDEIWIVVREDFCCQADYNGPFEATVTVHVRVPDSWGTPQYWAWTQEADISTQWAAFAKRGEWYAIELPADTVGLNISADHFGIETGDFAFESGWDVWVVVTENNWTYFYNEPTEDDIRSAFGS